MDSLRGLSHRVSLEVSSGGCRGQGSQIQDGAVTHGVVGGVVWWVYLRVGIRSIIFLYIFLFGYISFCILVCFLPRNIFVEEDVLL